MIHETTIERELDLRVSYNYTPGCRGARDSLCGKANAGPPLEPDSPPEIEITEVFDCDRNCTIDLTPKELEQIEAEIWEEIGNANDN